MEVSDGAGRDPYACLRSLKIVRWRMRSGGNRIPFNNRLPTRICGRTGGSCWARLRCQARHRVPLNDGVRKNGGGARSSGTDPQEEPREKLGSCATRRGPTAFAESSGWTTNSAAFPFLRAKLSVGWESGDEGRRTRRSPHPLHQHHVWPQISITMQILCLIESAETRRILVTENLFVGNTTGVTSRDCDLQLTNNRFQGNGVGLRVMGNVIPTAFVFNNLIDSGTMVENM